MLLLLTVPNVDWIVLVAGITAINTIPVLMPPTWPILAWVHSQSGMPVLPVAALGAISATTGRGLLALGTRSFGTRLLPRSWKRNIHALVEIIQSRPAYSIATLGLFAWGPISANHLFIAAGLSGTPLPVPLAIFGTARFISYFVLISVTQSAAASLDELIGPSVSRGATVAFQVLGFLLLILVMRYDWTKVLNRLKPTEPGYERQRELPDQE